MRALILSLALALVPSIALAQTAATSATASPHKAAAKKKPKGAAGAGSARSSFSTAGAGAAVGALNAPVDPDEVQPLDVSNMLFDPHSIQQVIQHHMPQIQSCYEKVLSTSGQRIEGRVAVGFIIDVTGTVADARLLPKKSTLTDERVIDCVLLRVRRLVFPKPPDNRRYPIEFPFNLTVKK